MLRWWDYWLKGIDTGVMDEPVCRAELTDGRLVPVLPEWKLPAVDVHAVFAAGRLAKTWQHGVLSISWPHP
jgi:hypothetical protein